MLAQRGKIVVFERIITIKSSVYYFLGIKVLLDFVPNHASTESVYFTRSEARTPGYENYFVWADPRTDPNNASNRLVPSNWV